MRAAHPALAPAIALAPAPKTTLCRNWCTTGSCPYGLRCLFAHGDGDLRRTRSGPRPSHEPPQCDQQQLDAALAARLTSILLERPSADPVLSEADLRGWWARRPLAAVGARA